MIPFVIDYIQKNNQNDLQILTICNSNKVIYNELQMVNKKILHYILTKNKEFNVSECINLTYEYTAADYIENSSISPDIVYMDSFENNMDIYETNITRLREFFKLINKNKKFLLHIGNIEESKFIRNVFNYLDVNPINENNKEIFWEWLPEYYEKLKIVVSLTTIPSRFKNIKNKIENIYSQSYKNIEIQINIPKKYNRFKSYDLNLLSNLNYYLVEKDYGPYTKIYPTWQRYKDKKQLIFYTDDDVCYPYRTLEVFLWNFFTDVNPIIGAFTDIITNKLDFYKEKNNFFSPTEYQPYVYNGYENKKSHIVKSLFANFVYGHGGCLLNSNSIILNSMPNDIPDMFYNDDIWLSYQFNLQGKKILCTNFICDKIYYLSTNDALHDLHHLQNTWNNCLNYCRKNNIFN